MAIPLIVWGLAAAAAGSLIWKNTNKKENNIIDVESSSENCLEHLEKDELYESCIINKVADNDISPKEFKAIMEDRAEFLRIYLKDFRKLAGWTAEELGDMLGVTRQAINNIERGKSNLSISQYMAITTLLYRKSLCGGDAAGIIPQILYSLVENREIYTREQIEDIEFAFLQLADAKKFGRSAEMQERIQAQLPKDFEEQIKILAMHVKRALRNTTKS